MSNKTKDKINRGLSDIQQMFANAIDYDALEEALKDQKVLEILNKINY